MGTARACIIILSHATSFSAKPNIHDTKLMLCIWWDLLGVVYYGLLKRNETITGEVRRWEEIVVSDGQYLE